MAVAGAAALAMRLVQINLALGGGNLSSARGFFTPMRAHRSIEVPTLPGITFRFDASNSLGMESAFDIFLFSLRPNVTRWPSAQMLTLDYDSTFVLNDVILNPLLLPQAVAPKEWPGDGRGPMKTRCMAAPCNLGKESD